MPKGFLSEFSGSAPGEITSVEWMTWTSKDGKYDFEGFEIEIDGWEYPLRYSASVLKDGGISANSDAGRLLSRLDELGYNVRDQDFNLDVLIGKLPFLEQVEIENKSGTIRKISLPTDFEDVEKEPEEPKTTTLADVKEPSEDYGFIVYSAIKDMTKEKGADCTRGKLINRFIEKKSAYLIDDLDKTLEKLAKKNKIKEMKDGKLSVI